MSAPLYVYLSEWSSIDWREEPGLKGLELNDQDRRLLDELNRENKDSINVLELRQGLSISTKQYIGTVTLTCCRIVVKPKINIDNLTRLLTYALDIGHLVLPKSDSYYEKSIDFGLIDILGVTLLREVNSIQRAGITRKYVEKHETLSSPKGRIDMSYLARTPVGTQVYCHYDELSVDHLHNQVLASGLNLAANLMDTKELGFELRRTSERFFLDIKRLCLSEATINEALDKLDRQSSHYRNALNIISLIYKGYRLGDYMKDGDMYVSSFFLDMNKVFERFLERYFAKNCPFDVDVSAQDRKYGVFRYSVNPQNRYGPSIRPDLVLYSQGQPIIIADAKYKNRVDFAPDSAEIYQLCIYGLSYNLPLPRKVIILYPLGTGQANQEQQISFTPAGYPTVELCLIGVPIDSIVEQGFKGWWPESMNVIASNEQKAKF